MSTTDGVRTCLGDGAHKLAHAHALGLASPVAATVATGIPAGMGMQVAVFTPGGDGAGRRLPVAYRDAVEVLAEAGMTLRAMQVCQALGLGPSLRASMGIRVKLKRLVKRGWLVETSPGPFACASRVLALDCGSRPSSPKGEAEG